MITTNNNRSIEITLANQLGYEQVAMACSATFARLYGFSKARIEDLKTVVGEASVNAMQHGNKGRPDAKVTVSMKCDNETMVVQVADEGGGIKKFPPDPDIDKIIEEEELITGFGLFLIKQLADQVEFNQVVDEGHTVKMTINMKEQV
jgi:serine/threonine-protein kinase RsbW